MLILIRGISGSGKSTTALYLSELLNAKNYEADQYFLRNGEYKFNPKELSKAHYQCRKKTYEALKKEENVIVSNTFTKFWEMEKYFQMAKDLYIPVVIIEKVTYFKSLHVTDSQLEKMKARFETKEQIMEQVKEKGYSVLLYFKIKELDEKVITLLKHLDYKEHEEFKDFKS